MAIKNGTTVDATILATFNVPGSEPHTIKFLSRKELLRYMRKNSIFLSPGAPVVRGIEKYKQAVIKQLFPWTPIIDEKADRYTDDEFFAELSTEGVLLLINYTEGIAANISPNAKIKHLDYTNSV